MDDRRLDLIFKIIDERPYTAMLGTIGLGVGAVITIALAGVGFVIDSKNNEVLLNKEEE